MSKKAASKRRSECPISFGLDIFGDKWTLLILRDMLLFGCTRFSDFATPERIATNVLADRLTRLEAAKIITKKQDTTLKNQNTYQVTDKGRDLAEVLVEIMLWGLKYDERTLVAKDFIVRISNDLHNVTDEVRAAIKTNTFESYRAKEMGIGSGLYK
jgi:DNA-binding HxlR family transcriptional regulator